MIKKAWARWNGGIKDGGGTISTETGVLKEAPYGFNARFEGGKGTNPEELIGAAHAGGFAITASHLTVSARVPGADQATFQRIANQAKSGCPVSKVLNAQITMTATLEA